MGSGPWYAPYVDATLTPTYAFEDERQNPSNDVVLGFIVASRDGRCVPTWGTFYSLEGAESALDLDRRISRMRARGGTVMVSFGGAANDELAVRCSRPELENAYAQVIDRYQPSSIDFDVEGTALGDSEANVLRADAVKALQDNAAAAHRKLSVWLTLPVAPTGLPPAAVGTIDAMLDAHVDLAGVNLLTMDYGSSRPAGIDLASATTRAVDASEAQLDVAYRQHGLQLTADSLFHKLGITPMIGQNDVPAERVTLADAKKLVQLARKRHLGRISIWSLNRDMPCGAQMDLGIVSNLCSGIDQKPLSFTSIFAQVPGRSTDAGRREDDAASHAGTRRPRPQPVPDLVRYPDVHGRRSGDVASQRLRSQVVESLRRSGCTRRARVGHALAAARARAAGRPSGAGPEAPGRDVPSVAFTHGLCQGRSGRVPGPRLRREVVDAGRPARQARPRLRQLALGAAHDEGGSAHSLTCCGPAHAPQVLILVGGTRRRCKPLRLPLMRKRPRGKCLAPA